MITFNGLKYYKNDSDLVDTLFQTGATGSGNYKLYKNRIELTSGSGSVLAIVRERGIFKDASSVILSSKGSNGRYLHSTSSADDKLFNIPSDYMAKLEQANKLLIDNNI